MSAEDSRTVPEYDRERSPEAAGLRAAFYRAKDNLNPATDGLQAAVGAFTREQRRLGRRPEEVVVELRDIATLAGVDPPTIRDNDWQPNHALRMAVRWAVRWAMMEYFAPLPVQP